MEGVSAKGYCRPGAVSPSSPLWQHTDESHMAHQPKMPRHYDHAPIVEAIIDLRVARPGAVSLETLKSISESLKSQFPKVTDISMVSMGFHQLLQKGKGEFSSQQERVGFRLENGLGNRVLQIQRLGFTYSHLPPYSEWVTFREEAKPLWATYLAATKIPHVARVAVRVINKLRLPTSTADLSRYSNLVATLPQGIPGVPETFFTQMQMSGSAWADGARVLVNAGAVPQADGKAELLLDFDIFVEATRDASSPEIWDVLDKLSTAKDDLFEACITNDTRKLIA
jgi:uncharacterized protein (TIGR04255 family)